MFVKIFNFNRFSNLRLLLNKQYVIIICFMQQLYGRLICLLHHATVA